MPDFQDEELFDIWQNAIVDGFIAGREERVFCAEEPEDYSSVWVSVGPITSRFVRYLRSQDIGRQDYVTKGWAFDILDQPTEDSYDLLACSRQMVKSLKKHFPELKISSNSRKD